MLCVALREESRGGGGSAGGGAAIIGDRHFRPSGAIRLGKLGAGGGAGITRTPMSPNGITDSSSDHESPWRPGALTERIRRARLNRTLFHTLCLRLANLARALSDVQEQLDRAPEQVCDARVLTRAERVLISIAHKLDSCEAVLAEVGANVFGSSAYEEHAGSSIATRAGKLVRRAARANEMYHTLGRMSAVAKACELDLLYIRNFLEIAAIVDKADAKLGDSQQRPVRHVALPQNSKLFSNGA